jgi:hypothetical protein
LRYTAFACAKVDRVVCATIALVFGVLRGSPTPVDLGFLAQDDCADKGISAVGTLDAAGAQVGF